MRKSEVREVARRITSLETDGKTVSWIRTKLSFEVIRSAVLGRGSRTPWKRTSSFHTDDFGLLAHDAGIHETINIKF